MAFPAIAAAVGAYTANNAMSEIHAGRQAEREMEMMEAQNAMNRSNVLGAYMQRVQGMKMAGLNPALAAEGTPAVAAVSKGSAASGENVEFNLADLLLEKQAENLEAQTQKTIAEANKIKGVDTENTIADTLYKNASTEERTQAGERVRQLNEQYSDQNKALEGYGKVLAEKWQSSPWYNHLAPDTKDTIDSIASGTTPLTVGGMDALKRVIDSQKDLSDADRKLVQNAFDNAVTEAMIDDEAVMEAITQAPKNQQDLLKRQAEKIKAELPKIRAEIANLAADTKYKKLSTQDLTNRIKAYINTDLDYLRADNYEKGGDAQSTAKYWTEWFKAQVEHLIPMVGSAYVGGRAFGTGAGKSMSQPKLNPTPSTPLDDGPGYTTVSPRWTREGRSSDAFRGPLPDNTTVHDMSRGVQEVDLSRGRRGRSRSK